MSPTFNWWEISNNIKEHYENKWSKTWSSLYIKISFISKQKTTRYCYHEKYIEIWKRVQQYIIFNIQIIYKCYIMKPHLNTSSILLTCRRWGYNSFSIVAKDSKLWQGDIRLYYHRLISGVPRQANVVHAVADCGKKENFNGVNKIFLGEIIRSTGVNQKVRKKKTAL